MADNSTAHAAADYEREVASVIPFHADLLDLVVDVALAAVPAPGRWLDTGGGPGRLVELARARAPEAAFTLADPSAAMLELARARLGPGVDRLVAPSHALPELPPFDVVTAVLCHHYYEGEAGRLQALRRLRALLRPGGALVTVENVRAESEAGHALQRRRWEAWQRGRGRAEAVIAVQLAREGTQFFPIPASALRGLIKEAGFAPVELVWRAYNQAGFLAFAGAG
jgi:tRNA (cmo5U34)-methyltransferase